MSRAVVIIVTSNVPRTFRENTLLSGFPLGYFSHSQNFRQKEDVEKLLQLNISLLKKVNPGVDTDAYLVCNYDQNGFAIDYDKYDGISIFRGKLRVVKRENIGRAFGGYSYAYNNLIDLYDYFVTTEDDIIFTRENYLSKMIFDFKSKSKVGFVSAIGLSTSTSTSRFWGVKHAHGGVGLISKSVLNAILQDGKFMPYSADTDRQSLEYVIALGEIAFSDLLQKSGFRLKSASEKNYDFAYDYMRGINVRRYANTVEYLQYLYKNIRKLI